MVLSVNAARLVESFFDSLSPPPELTVYEWSDRYRILPSTSSSEQGPWRTSRFPFLKEIMLELSPQSPRKEIAVIKGAQLGFTELALNWIFYSIDYNPCPILYVQKTIEAVQKFSKQRFSQSVRTMPNVFNKIGEQKSRDSSNTIRVKNFPGGILMLGGANSASSLRSMPIQYLILDEVDSFESDIQDEGDPVEIAIRRTSNFPRRKIYYLSTPTIKETSKIEPLFEEGDQRYYHVVCPFCKGLQKITWDRLKYDNDDPKTVRMICKHCEGEIPERYKTWMLAEENGAKWIPENPGAEIASFSISSLYSPLGFYSWEEAVRSWLKATKTFNKEALKVFINTVLGESFSEAGKSIESSWLEERKEEYGDTIPNAIRVITAGVDVQDDRLECEVVGYGANQESWSIDYRIFMGDTEHEAVWEQLDTFLKTTYFNDAGVELSIACTGIDSGHRARVVYRFCLNKEYRRIFPVKGRDGWGQGYLKRPIKKNQDGVFLFIIYVDELKSRIYSQLSVEDPGPAYCHFPKLSKYDSEYFRKLTAERLTTVVHNGRKKLRWVCPKGRRNEALDCRVYSISALNILDPNFDLLERTNQVIGAPKKRRKRRVSKGL